MTKQEIGYLAVERMYECLKPWHRAILWYIYPINTKPSCVNPDRDSWVYRQYLLGPPGKLNSLRTMNYLKPLFVEHLLCAQYFTGIIFKPPENPAKESIIFILQKETHEMLCAWSHRAGANTARIKTQSWARIQGIEKCFLPSSRWPYFWLEGGEWGWVSSVGSASVPTLFIVEYFDFNYDLKHIYTHCIKISFMVIIEFFGAPLNSAPHGHVSLALTLVGLCSRYCDNLSEV